MSNYIPGLLAVIYIVPNIYSDYDGKQQIACTKPIIKVSENETITLGCKARPKSLTLYYCRITVVLLNDKKVRCLYYSDKDQGYELVPYEGYCEHYLFNKSVKQIGNGAKGGCGFEINATKTNLRMSNITLYIKHVTFLIFYSKRIYYKAVFKNYCHL